MSYVISAVLMILGAAFMLVAAIGVFRMPDLLTRMHASTKAGAVGAGLILLSVAVYFGELGVATRAVAAVVFVILTAPVSAHMIGRAAYFVGVPLWEGTIIDELRERYDLRRPGPDSDIHHADSE
jgi:multicomponent Na+:H+ antiporter subunit G